MMSPMKFRRELSYDADPAAVFAMLSDPAFREKVAATQQVISVDVTAHEVRRRVLDGLAAGAEHLGPALDREEVRR